MAQACDICAAFGKEMREHRCIPGKRQQKAKQRGLAKITYGFGGDHRRQEMVGIVDAKSKWPEVVQMGLTTVEKTIEKLKDIFSLHDLPEQIVVDNGPQFIAKEFKEYCRRRSIELIFIHLTITILMGRTERFVQTFKKGYYKGRKAGKTLAATGNGAPGDRDLPGQNVNETFVENDVGFDEGLVTRY
ncbi:hypothetical protein OSTOST_12925 [Ostertagia ostertagi]